MQSRKVALTSQDFVEQGNGLVQVSLGYTAAASDAASVLPLFRVDSQPPITPSIIDANSLQSQKLYMTNFSSSQANGLLQITASYVGANLNALRKPLIFDSVERKSFNISVATFRSTSLAYDYTGGTPYISDVFPRIEYDFYRIDAYLRSEEQQVAIVANEVIDYAAPPVISTNERAGLVMGATFTRRGIGAKFEADRYSGVTSNQQAQAVFNQYGDKKLPGYEFRSLTALQILEALASPSTSSKRSGMDVINSSKLEHVTPTVRLISNIYELEFNAAVLYGRYGATIA
jgi:hypothetical protein